MSDRTKDGEALAAELPDDAFEVRVSLTVAVRYRGERPGLQDALEIVVGALQKAELPEGSHLHGPIDLRVRTAKEIRGDLRRAERRRAREHETFALRSVFRPKPSPSDRKVKR